MHRNRAIVLLAGVLVLSGCASVKSHWPFARSKAAAPEPVHELAVRVPEELRTNLLSDSAPCIRDRDPGIFLAVDRYRELLMPQSSVMGTSASRARASQGGITVKPSGFSSLAAYFGVVLSPETPTLLLKRSSWGGATTGTPRGFVE